MKFNFKAFALCEMTVYDQEDILAELLGVHISRKDAEYEIQCMVEGRRMDHEQANARLYWKVSFVMPIFQIVPLDGMEFDSMDQAQDMIQKAAVLQQQGCGIEAGK